MHLHMILGASLFCYHVSLLQHSSRRICLLNYAYTPAKCKAEPLPFFQEPIFLTFQVCTLLGTHMSPAQMRKGNN